MFDPDYYSRYMHYHKAILFGDHQHAAMILEEDGPVKCKHLGRKVRGFVQEIWDRESIGIVKRGNLAKFKGNDLLSLLIRANLASDLPESARLSDEAILAQFPTFLVAGVSSRIIPLCVPANESHPVYSTKVSWGTDLLH